VLLYGLFKFRRAILPTLFQHTSSANSLQATCAGLVRAPCSGQVVDT
jgi:hypothetical protein